MQEINRIGGRKKRFKSNRDEDSETWKQEKAIWSRCAYVSIFPNMALTTTVLYVIDSFECLNKRTNAWNSSTVHSVCRTLPEPSSNITLFLVVFVRIFAFYLTPLFRCVTLFLSIYLVIPCIGAHFHSSIGCLALAPPHHLSAFCFIIWSAIYSQLRLLCAQSGLPTIRLLSIHSTFSVYF